MVSIFQKWKKKKRHFFVVAFSQLGPGLFDNVIIIILFFDKVIIIYIYFLIRLLLLLFYYYHFIIIILFYYYYYYFFIYLYIYIFYLFMFYVFLFLFQYLFEQIHTMFLEKISSPPRNGYFYFILLSNFPFKIMMTYLNNTFNRSGTHVTHGGKARIFFSLQKRQKSLAAKGY